jgi:arsenite methyltransferase
MTDPEEDRPMTAKTSPQEDLVEQVRSRYATAATTVGDGCCASPDQVADIVGDGFGLPLYDGDDHTELPEAAKLASLGCGNPTAVAELREGETVLDLGSGGGIDVLLSARRVGPTGKAYGLDMTDEMLDLARRNAAEAGATNVEFLAGRIEAIPLPDAHVDVVISNCVINLSVDKPAVMSGDVPRAAPGWTDRDRRRGRRRRPLPRRRAERGSYVGCIAGALSFAEYRDC